MAIEDLDNIGERYFYTVPDIIGHLMIDIDMPPLEIAASETDSFPSFASLNDNVDASNHNSNSDSEQESDNNLTESENEDEVAQLLLEIEEQHLLLDEQRLLLAEEQQRCALLEEERERLELLEEDQERIDIHAYLSIYNNNAVILPDSSIIPLPDVPEGYNGHELQWRESAANFQIALHELCISFDSLSIIHKLNLDELCSQMKNLTI